MVYSFSAFDPLEHVIEDFDCGHGTEGQRLNDWLEKHAEEHDKTDQSRVFVMCQDDQTQVLGYFTLNAFSVRRCELTKRARAGIYGKDDRQIGAILLGKLALDTSLQGQGLGPFVMRNIFDKVLIATEIVAAKFLVLHVRDKNLIAYYKKFGFEYMGQENNLMVIPVEKIRNILEQADQD